MAYKSSKNKKFTL